MILVDTNVWSELTKPRSDPAVLAWLEANDDDLMLSMVVLAEIHYGIELATAAPKRHALAAWLAGLEARYWGQTLAFGRPSARKYNRLAVRPEVKARQPQIIDIQIAEQAIQHGIQLATRNARDFDWIGIDLIDPWRG